MASGPFIDVHSTLQFVGKSHRCIPWLGRSSRATAQRFIFRTPEICIKQDQGTRDGFSLIFEEDEVDSLIELLAQAKLELAEDRRVMLENEDN